MRSAHEELQNVHVASFNKLALVGREGEHVLQARSVAHQVSEDGPFKKTTLRVPGK